MGVAGDCESEASPRHNADLTNRKRITSRLHRVQVIDNKNVIGNITSTNRILFAVSPHYKNYKLARRLAAGDTHEQSLNLRILDFHHDCSCSGWTPAQRITASAETGHWPLHVDSLAL